MKFTHKHIRAGFTLIELLVVIAIIGILSAIVIANLNTARRQAQDAKVKSQLSAMRSAGELYFGSHNNSYDTSSDCHSGLFVDNASGMGGIVQGTPGIVCGSNGTNWAAAAALSDGTTYWCVASVGESRPWASTDAPTNGITACQ